MRDKPWAMRTYAGHSSAAGSNALYRRNLAQGQTGLSVAFDLPTQTGYDPDDLREAGLSDVPVIVGGIIPGSDARALEAQGVAAMFTPKDFGLTQIMDRIVDVIRSANGLD